jgi:hypothetical protein
MSEQTMDVACLDGPEGVLRRGSARIRDLLAGAPAGVWSAGGEGRVVAPLSPTSSIVTAVADTYPSGGSARQRAVTDYIASWHPEVAAAVADLLDITADDLHENSILDRPETGEYAPPAPEAWWCDYCGGAIESLDYTDAARRCDCPRWTKALDLARACLRETGPSAEALTAESTAEPLRA